MEKQKILNIKKRLDDRKKISDWLDEMRVIDYTINEDLTVDVDGDVLIFSKGLTEIPIQFGKVTGDFWCNDNQLNSLKGCPNSVGESFWCDENQLVTLKWCPEYVGSFFYCNDNNLITLEHAPKMPDGIDNNPCSYIYKGLGTLISNHQKCREVFGYDE